SGRGAPLLSSQDGILKPSQRNQKERSQKMAEQQVHPDQRHVERAKSQACDQSPKGAVCFHESLVVNVKENEAEYEQRSMAEPDAKPLIVLTNERSTFHNGCAGDRTSRSSVYSRGIARRARSFRRLRLDGVARCLRRC